MAVTDFAPDEIARAAGERYADRAATRFSNEIIEDRSQLLPREILKRMNYLGASFEDLQNAFLAKAEKPQATERQETRETLERVIGGDDILGVEYLKIGLEKAKAICKVNIVNCNGESGSGTGFLIGKNLLMTNCHVLPEKSCAVQSYAEFNYENDINHRKMNSIFFEFDPDIFYYSAPENDLDFALVYVKEDSTDGQHKLSDFGFIDLIPSVGKISIGEYVTILQHPLGNLKSIAFRNNKLIDVLDKYLHYETDTEPGSSGSSVFNDQWEIVCLHHSGVPAYDANGNQTGWVANEGIRVSKIVENIYNNFKDSGNNLLAHIMENAAKKAAPPVMEPVPVIPDVEPQPAAPVDDIPIHPTGGGYYDRPKDDTLKNDYYKGIDINDMDQLIKLIESTHKNQLDYNPRKYLYSDVEIHDDGKIQSIYSGNNYNPEYFLLQDSIVESLRMEKLRELSEQHESINSDKFEEFINGLEESLPYNCEHVVPQSWFNKKSPMRGDLHHLFACESGCNSFRGNAAYIDFPDYDGTDEALRNLCGKKEHDRFEPQSGKGIIARATLYCILRYGKKISFKYKPEDIPKLVTWASSAKYAVTDYERRRNMIVQSKQGNRNPLIDFPVLIEKIDFSKFL